MAHGDHGKGDFNLHRMYKVVHIAGLTSESPPCRAALYGLLTSQAYQRAVERSVIIGPCCNCPPGHPEPLGPDSEILYSSRDGLTGHPYAAALHDVERKFDVAIIYGRRTFYHPCTAGACHPEIILIDLAHANIHPINALKAWMYDEFAIESNRFEKQPQYDLSVRLAPAALAALRAVGLSDPGHPPVLIAHDYAGVPTALAAVLDPIGTFKTIFWAHDVPLARHLVQDSPGHDAMFYNVMDAAVKKNYYLNEVFGAQDFFFRQVLVNAARYCDNIMALSRRVSDELRFVSPQLDNLNIDPTYRGLTAEEISLSDKRHSKAKLQQYAHNLLGYRPDYIFTHVAHMALNKAFWRDLRVLHHLEEQFRNDGRTAVYYLLSTDQPARCHEDVCQMEESWGWPLAHREGILDLSHAEAECYTNIQQFNARSRNIKIVFVNQFGWNRDRCGLRMPEDMEFADLRKGADLEFGQSIYEPFGAAALEPLTYGSLCVLSSIAGARDLLESVSTGPLPDNIIIADYTDLHHEAYDMHSLLTVEQLVRDNLEELVSGEVARKILQRLPNDDAQAENLIRQGYELARPLNSDAICEKYFLPALQHAYHKRRALRSA